MTPAVSTTTSIRFSIVHLPPRERLPAYRHMLGRSVGNFEIEAMEDAFDFSATSYALPGLGIAHIASSALRIARTRETAADDNRDLVLGRGP